MSEWERVPLSDVIELQRGHDLPTDVRGSGRVPVIGSFGVTGFHDQAKYDGPGVAIGRSGASIGKATYVSEAYWPLNTCLFVRDFKGNDQRWVFHLLHLIDFAAFNSGSAQPSLNRNFLRSIPVLVPPLPEQRAIAEVLGSLDDKIAANTRIIETADQLAQLFAAKSSHHYELVPLTTVASVTMGTSPAGSSLNELGDGIVFYQGIRDFGVRFPRRRVWTTAPTRVAEVGDTLLSVRAPVGRVNLADESMCIGRGLAAVRSRTQTPYSLFNLLKAMPEVWQPFEAEGTVFGSINRVQLENVRVPLVPVEVADDLEMRLAMLETRLESALQENRTLAATRDALLPQLMSGKLRVRDAGRIAERSA